MRRQMGKGRECDDISLLPHGMGRLLGRSKRTASWVSVVIMTMGIIVNIGWARPSQAAESARSSERGAVQPEPILQPGTPDGSQGEGQGFAVSEYLVEGNTILPDDRVSTILNKHKGAHKTIKEVEQARRELEDAYHALGYPTVLVVVPEQTIADGIVRLQVVEGRVGEITVTDNRYYSRYNILGKLPSLKIGAVLRESDFVKELDALNANPDLKVAPLLKPGSEQGLVNVELKTKDRFPGHFRLQGDNQGPLTTPKNRLVAEVQYTNLFNADHMLNLQTVQTPQDWGAVQTYGMSYVAPIQWPDHLLSVYASKTISTSQLAATSLGIGGGNVSIAGNATVGGFRYVFPILSGLVGGTHQLAVGMDYKRLEKTEATFPQGLGTAVVLSPIQYTPASVSYNGFVVDGQGITKLSSTVKGYVSGWMPGGKKVDFAGDPNDPFEKPGNRAGSTGNFVVVQGSIARTQNLPYGFSLLLHADGQWGNEPLIVTEQYFVGGMDTVRGYQQFEALGDIAIRGRAELTSPDLIPIPFDRIWQRRRSGEWNLNWKLAVFYDAANLWVRDALPGQRDQFRLEGVGAGLRIKLPKDAGDLRIDQGWALQNSNATKRGDSFVHFLVTVGY